MTPHGPDPAPVRVNADDALEQLAVDWLLERDEGFAAGRAAAFQAWCAADPRHAAMVARLEQGMALLEEMPAVRAPLEEHFGVPGTDDEATAGRFGRWRGGFRLWATGLAAALVLGLGGWGYWTWRASEADHFVNEAGGPRRLVLGDGSVVHLNGHSDLRVAYSRHERRVQLTIGEAHFEVFHDSGRPFVVAAGGLAVRAIGTAFNVRLSAAAVDVVVEEGRVEVAAVQAQRAAFPAVPVPQLGSGERAHVARDGAEARPTIERIDPRDLRAALAWHRRSLVVADVPLREVIAQFNRRNVIQLAIAEPELGGRKVGGAFVLDQVDAFVRLLEREGDIVAERRGADEIVLRRAR